MENSTEALSSPATNHYSFSGAADVSASEESGWTTYIDYFMETQRRQKEGSCAALSTDDVGSRSTSQNSGDCGSSRLPALIEPSEASGRLKLKKEGKRKKKVVYDESLEDTATSPMSSPKLIESRESDANHQKKGDSCDELSHCKNISAAELAGYNSFTNNGANTTDRTDNDCEYDSELRKKGLCLVPLSAFHV